METHGEDTNWESEAISGLESRSFDSAQHFIFQAETVWCVRVFSWTPSIQRSVDVMPNDTFWIINELPSASLFLAVGDGGTLLRRVPRSAPLLSFVCATLEFQGALATGLCVLAWAGSTQVLGESELGSSGKDLSWFGGGKSRFKGDSWRTLAHATAPCWLLPFAIVTAESLFSGFLSFPWVCLSPSNCLPSAGNVSLWWEILLVWNL